METKLAESSSEAIREEVRRRYGATARGEPSSCGDECCTSTSAETLGYSTEQSAIAPEAANLGLGCGNPVAIASLQPAQTVLDLGSGAGFDCFLAARAVGPSGTVIGGKLRIAERDGSARTRCVASSQRPLHESTVQAFMSSVGIVTVETV